MMYNMPLYRPPSEAYSLIIQVTLGCSHNKCNFCSMYKSKKFTIKSLEEIKKEIDIFRNIYGKVEKIFLADGDALIIPIDTLKEILKYIKKVFPECKRITLYGSPKSILYKTIDELKELKELGLSMIYMGIESGDNLVLNYINKGVASSELLNAGLKVKESGILLSVTVIAGIGGKGRTIEHSINTGKLISDISPDFLGVLSLMIEENTELYKDIKCGKFLVLSDIEVLKEIRNILQNINSKEKIVFRCNHASNYLLLRGDLPKDREKLIREIDNALENRDIRDEVERML